MNIKFIWVIIFIILGVSKILEVFHNEKKYMQFINKIIYILFTLAIVIYSSGFQSWKEMIENWHASLLAYTVFLIISILIAIFNGYTECVYLNNRKNIIDVIKQVLADDNYDYHYEENFGRIVFKINRFNKITLTPVTKLLKDEVKYYNITYKFFYGKKFKNLQEKIYHKFNTTIDYKKKKKQFYFNILFAVIFFCLSVLMITLN